MEHYIKVCPKCKREYAEPSALSREDNETLICPKCGTREALEAAGAKPEEVEMLLQVIYHDED